MKKALLWMLLAFSLLFSACSKAEEPAPAPMQVTPSSAPVENEPVEHSFPEGLLDFMAGEKGVESIDLSQAQALVVTVNHCEYAEPVQIFYDTATITAAAKAMEKVTVTADHDYIDSTASIYGFIFEDAQGNTIGSVGFQYDEEMLLLGKVGRYPITGTEELFSIKGILLSSKDWRDYHDGVLPGPGVQD